MDQHKASDSYVYIARNRTHAQPFNLNGTEGRPEPTQKIERVQTRAAKVTNRDRENGDRTSREDALLQFLPDLNRATNNSQGFLLTDTAFKPLYANDYATSILNFSGELKPDAPRAAVAERIRTILKCDRFSRNVRAAEFVSGKRLYICRPFLLESRNRPVRRPMVILLLERQARDPFPLSEVSREFHLSPRECETVRYLSRGLTTKEVAQHMSVSPNTVKQFVRLIMSKMGVTTRSGIVGKLVAS
jgi:DNA-binding CsgD family transcriptional regulator